MPTCKRSDLECPYPHHPRSFRPDSRCARLCSSQAWLSFIFSGWLALVQSRWAVKQRQRLQRLDESKDGAKGKGPSSAPQLPSSAAAALQLSWRTFRVGCGIARRERLSRRQRLSTRPSLRLPLRVVVREWRLATVRMQQFRRWSSKLLDEHRVCSLYARLHTEVRILKSEKCLEMIGMDDDHDAAAHAGEDDLKRAQADQQKETKKLDQLCGTDRT